MADRREWVEREHYDTCEFNGCGLRRDYLVTSTRPDTLQGLSTPKTTSRMECARGHYQYP